ncbi:hypothetical protein C8F01DRAFT_1260085 [Mycena amicta]|nr:hypothetical protein C8F01DRAFT_1260085 [Mycena amicta]
MTVLPNELLELIAQSIESSDYATLKACCLAASVFRRPCQQQLHFLLTLNQYSYAQTATHFDESPNLADCVKTLRLDIPDNSQDATDAARVLRRLHNVACANIECSVDKGWNELPEEITSAILPWLQQFAGRMSHLMCWNLQMVPIPTMLSFLTAARSVTLLCVGVKPGTPEELSAALPAGSGNLEHLNSGMSPSVNALVLLPEYRQLTENLRSLVLKQDGWTDAPEGTEAALCAAAARTLEEIYLDCFDPLNSTFVLPSQLPNLQVLTIALRSTDLQPSPFLSRLISTVLDPSYSTAFACLSFRSATYVRYSNMTTYTFVNSFMAMLDDLLDQHPTIQAVRWTTVMSFIPYSGADKAKHAAAVAEALRTALPKATAKGLLEISAIEP